MGKAFYDEAAEADLIAYQSDPVAWTQRRIAEAAADQAERLQPQVQRVLEQQEEREWRAVGDEAIDAMDRAYGSAWHPYKDAIYEYVEDRPELFPASLMLDPQKAAERLQMVYRTVRAEQDAVAQGSEWDRVRATSPTPYMDSRTRDMTRGAR